MSVVCRILSIKNQLHCVEAFQGDNAVFLLAVVCVFDYGATAFLKAFEETDEIRRSRYFKLISLIITSPLIITLIITIIIITIKAVIIKFK